MGFNKGYKELHKSEEAPSDKKNNMEMNGHANTNTSTKNIAIPPVLKKHEVFSLDEDD